VQAQGGARPETYTIIHVVGPTLAESWISSEMPMARRSSLSGGETRLRSGPGEGTTSCSIHRIELEERHVTRRLEGVPRDPGAKDGAGSALGATRPARAVHRSVGYFESIVSRLAE
jgi:hypothetical protein